MLGDLIHEIQKARESSTEAILIRPIVSPEEWIESPYYFSNASTTYPFWKEHFIKVFSGRYDEILITGSTSSGKTQFALTCALYKIYQFSCYLNFQALFDLDISSAIMAVYLAITKDQAMKTGFSTLIRMIDSTPYFQEIMPRDEDSQTEIRFSGRNFLGLSGSLAAHFTGMNLFICILDEANFLQGGADAKFERAQAIYRESTNRRKGRFATSKTEEQGLSILLSSADTENSFLETRVREMEQSGDTGVYLVSGTKISIKRHQYSKEEFYVFRGDAYFNPFVVDEFHKDQFYKYIDSQGYSHEDIPWESKEEFCVKNPNSFVAIPEDFRRTFVTDPVGSLKEIAGIAVKSSGKLYDSKEKWDQALANGARLGLRHPFTEPEFVISTGDERRIENYYIPGIVNWGKWDYFFRIDQSLVKDGTGLACCHVEPISATDPRPFLVVDFIVRILPPEKPNEIDLFKIHTFIAYLKKTHRIRIRQVSTDQYQSAQGRQYFEKIGIPAELYSVDRSDEAYLDFTYMLNAEIVAFYEHEVFRFEFFNLRHDRADRKVDHPKTVGGKRGSKDLCDATVGCAIQATQFFLNKKRGVIAVDTIREYARSMAMEKYSNEVSYFGDYITEKQYSDSQVERLAGKHKKKYGEFIEKYRAIMAPRR